MLGRPAFLAVLLLDAGKGALAVGLPRLLDWGAGTMGVALLAVVIGHLYPLQLRGQGGKGVATSLGGLLAMDPVVVGLLALAAGPGILLTGRVVPGGLAVYLLVPALGAWRAWPGPVWIAAVVLVVLVLAAHGPNLAAWWRERSAARPREGGGHAR